MCVCVYKKFKNICARCIIYYFYYKVFWLSICVCNEILFYAFSLIIAPPESIWVSVVWFNAIL